MLRWCLRWFVKQNKLKTKQNKLHVDSYHAGARRIFNCCCVGGVRAVNCFLRVGSGGDTLSQLCFARALLTSASGDRTTRTEPVVGPLLS